MRHLEVAVAAARNEGTVTSALAVKARSHTSAVLYLMKDLVQGAKPVYVIELRGRFVCSGCSRPSGAKSPRGTVLIDVLDAHSFRGEDFSLTDKWVSLAGLGRPFPVPV
jgi:hypothetical protein